MLEGEKYNSICKPELNFFKNLEKLTDFFCYFNILKYSIEIENEKKDYSTAKESNRETQESIEKE